MYRHRYGLAAAVAAVQAQAVASQVGQQQDRACGSFSHVLC